MECVHNDKEFYFLSVKHPMLPLSSDFEEYLATNEDFKKYIFIFTVANVVFLTVLTAAAKMFFA